MARSKSSNFVKYKEVDPEPGLHGRTFCQLSAISFILYVLCTGTTVIMWLCGKASS